MPDIRLSWPGRVPPPPPTAPPLHPLLHLPGTGPHARVVAGEALDVLDRLLVEGLGGQVDLIYLDPPFGAGVDWTRRRELDTADGPRDVAVHAYPDPATDWTSWLAHTDALIDRVDRLLSPRGAVYLHLDFRRAPHARLLMDERLGMARLRNEIIWSYGLGGSSKDRYGRKHDVILYYAKDPRHTHFVPPQVRATSARLAGRAKGATDVWVTAHAGEDATLDGAWPDDLIDATLSNTDPQRTGYPTQKPLALLQRIVHASLPPGGLALDPMGGSGTLGVAAVQAGGRAILGDRSPVALDVQRARLVQAGAQVQVDAVSSDVRWRATSAAQVRQAGQAVTLEALAWPRAGDVHGLAALSAWGVVTADNVALAWWDGGAQRHRGTLEQTLTLRPGQPAALVMVDIDGQLWRQALTGT